MSSFKTRFSIGQSVVARKSGKGCQVVGFYVNSSGLSVDAVAPTSKRSWRFAEADLMTVAEAEKAAKAKAKAAKKPAPAPKPVKAVKKVVKAKPAPKSAKAPK